MVKKIEGDYKKIAVVGAGLSGLTAAYRLTHKGLDVDVFEAKERVGGRVFTVLMENHLGQMTEVELGAQNITDGGHATHFLGLVKELNLETETKTIDINQLIYSGGLKQHYTTLLADHNKGLQDLNLLSQEAENIGQLIEMFCGDNVLLKDALLTCMMAYEGINPYKQSIHHNFDTLQHMLSGGVAKAHEAYEHGYDQVVVSWIKGGNAMLPIALANYLENKIHYNKVLNKIELEAEGALLSFSDQSQYKYDYVVLAIPAATFRNIDFAKSNLESETLDKIKAISYGANYKLALPLKCGKRNHISSIVQENTLSFFNHDDSIHLLFVNDKAPNIQNFVESLSETYNYPIDTYEREIVKAEDQHYEAYNSGVSYNWKNDPYARGSYSGYSLSISEELDDLKEYQGTAYKSLFLPINNTLFFAGEHTTLLDCIGTMEAAVESGERIAKAIVNLMERV